MLTLEQIVERILSERPDLTREDVRLMIKQRRGEVGGLLTEEGAAYIVASDLGIDLTGRESLKTEIKIQDLVPGVNDVSIAGRVILVYPVQTFTRSDRTMGKMARVLVVDSTGVLSVVLWDDKADAVSQGEMVQGQIVKVLHGYVREGLDGKPELHVGVRGTVVINPPDVKAEDFPPIKKFFKKIAELREGDKHTNFIAWVARMFPVSTFLREGVAGRVVRLRLVDETGWITAVFWNDKVESVKGVEKGACLRIMGAKVKRGLKGLEAHIEKRAQVSIMREKPPHITLPIAGAMKIVELKPGMADVEVLARVVSVGSVREFTRPSGEVGRVATLIIGDATGNVQLTLWNEKTGWVGKINPGDLIHVEGAYTKMSAGGNIDLNVGRTGVVTINPPTPEGVEVPVWRGTVTPIGQLKVGLTGVSVEGTVLDVPEVRDVVTQRGETVKVASFRLRDSTGDVRVSVWRGLVDIVKNLPIGSEVRVGNAYVKSGLGGGVELTSGISTTVEILSKSLMPPSTQVQMLIEEAFPRRRIVELKRGEDAAIQGKIVKIVEKTCVYLACPTCFRKLKQQPEGFACERCGTTRAPTYRMIVNAILSDETGNVSAVFYGPKAEELLGITAEKAWELASQGDDVAPIKMAEERILGREVTVSGRATYNQFTGELQLAVRELQVSAEGNEP